MLQNKFKLKLYFFLFSGSGSCPECNIPLRRVNFRLQLFEDSLVDKEIEIRRRVLRDFNKSEEDFADLREFSDYQVQEIIAKLKIYSSKQSALCLHEMNKTLCFPLIPNSI